MNPTRHSLAPQLRVYTKSIDQAARTSTALLTFPKHDAQGDYVVPDGGDWSYHDSDRLNRVVNYDHGFPVGRAEDAQGNYGVALQQLDIDGTTHAVPVGTTRFFQTAKDCAGLTANARETTTCLHLAEQTQRLVFDDVLTGVSLEFAPDDRYPKSMTAIGECPLENRKAFKFDKWVGLGWAHTLMPINADARTLLPSHEKAVTLAHRGKLGGKSLCAPILKSLAPFKQIARPALVRGGFTPLRKAMNPDEMMAEPDGDEMPTSDETPGANKPTPMALHDIMQALTDILALCDQHLAGPAEHEGGLARITQVKDDITALLETLKGDASGMFPDAGFESPDGADGMPVSDDGGLMSKAFTKGYPRRFKKGDFKRLKADADAVTLSKKTFDDLTSVIKRIVLPSGR